MNQLKAAYPLPSGQSIEIVQGDLTREQVDAIVNAANSHLAHGGGVAGAIAHAGGPLIQPKVTPGYASTGRSPTPSPAYTSAGNLPCRTSSMPLARSGARAKKIASSLRLSAAAWLAQKSLGLGSIAFPAISTGIFGFPLERAARVILIALRELLRAKSQLRCQTRSRRPVGRGKRGFVCEGRRKAIGA